MTITEQKIINVRLRALRSRRKIWRDGIVQDPFRPEEFWICPTTRGRWRNGNPLVCADGENGGCEGCAATLARAREVVALTVQIETAEAALRKLTGQPEPAPKPVKAKARRRALITKSTGEQLALLV